MIRHDLHDPQYLLYMVIMVNTETMDNTTPSPLLESLVTPKAFDTPVGEEQSKCVFTVYCFLWPKLWFVSFISIFLTTMAAFWDFCPKST